MKPFISSPVPTQPPSTQEFEALVGSRIGEILVLENDADPRRSPNPGWLCILWDNHLAMTVSVGETDVDGQDFYWLSIAMGRDPLRVQKWPAGPASEWLPAEVSDLFRDATLVDIKLTPSRDSAIKRPVVVRFDFSNGRSIIVAPSTLTPATLAVTVAEPGL